MVGVDHEENYDNSYASINFKVYLDKEEGIPAYESGTMIYNTPQKALVDNYDMVTKASAKYKKMETTVRKTKVKKVTIRSAKSTKKKQIKIIWKKASGVSGYEVLYSADRRFKKAKTRTVSKSKTSLQIKGLKRRKIYNVRVRAYKTVYGKKVYGKYSKALKTKIR